MVRRLLDFRNDPDSSQLCMPTPSKITEEYSHKPGLPMKIQENISNQVDDLKLIISDSYIELCQGTDENARWIIQQSITERGQENIILAGEKSQLIFIKELPNMSQIEWRRVRILTYLDRPGSKLRGLSKATFYLDRNSAFTMIIKILRKNLEFKEREISC